MTWLPLLPQVIRILGTFDVMYLRNDTVVYDGLGELARRGVRSCWTGDGADELFAGYSFVFAKPPEEIERTVARFVATMHFNAPALGEALGVAVRSPYLHPTVIAFARSLRGSDLVLMYQGALMGKAPLRQAFAAELGSHHAFRRKDPIEIGSGATALASRAGQ